MDWNAVIAFATMIAAIAVACAAFQAGRSARIAKNQIDADSKLRKLDRAYSHSPYLSEQFQQTILEVDKLFPGWDERIERYSENYIRKKISKNAKTMRGFKTVLNHWGRFASEHQRELVDRDVAKKALALNLVRFCRAFENYIRSPYNKFQYKNLLILYELWKQ
jgi:hypothetical protein